MKRCCFLISAILPLMVFTQEPGHKTPQQIQQELDADEALYQRALKMFNPWYTGPLLTPSASMMPPGSANIQPYLFITDTYASFDKKRRSRSLPSDRITLNPQLGAVFGITNTMDMSIVLQGVGNWQNGTSGGGYGDMGIKVGWPITRQSLYVPAMKFSISQVFPTGRYQNLNTNGFNLSASGGGVWTTQFGFAISKVMFWSYLHPVNARLFLGYAVSVPRTVHGFNAYGGGYGTRAKVKPGNAFSADLGIEVTLTQRWVFSNDLIYSCQNETTASGHFGTTATGAPASMGGPYNDSLSLAPALEYNFSPNFGVLGGVWFTVYGRSSSNFISGIVSLSWSFPSS